MKAISSLSSLILQHFNEQQHETCASYRPRLSCMPHLWPIEERTPQDLWRPPVESSVKPVEALYALRWRSPWKLMVDVFISYEMLDQTEIWGIQRPNNNSNCVSEGFYSIFESKVVRSLQLRLKGTSKPMPRLEVSQQNTDQTITLPAVLFFSQRISLQILSAGNHCTASQKSMWCKKKRKKKER